MKVTQDEKSLYLALLNLGHEKKDLINFIIGARKCPMYGSIFHLPISSKLVKTLSAIYHHKLEFDINGIPVRTFISKTFEI